MKRKEIERKEMERREYREKIIFSLLLLGWRENGEKENKKHFFLLLGWREKWEERKSNDIKWFVYP